MATLKEPFALDRSLNTTEVTPRNIADVLAEGLSHITGRTASEVEYDNTDSGLTADNVQDALDEIAESVPTLPTTDIQTAVDEFETYNGGLLSECIIELVPVQSGSGDPSPDNVRPISGHTQVEVDVVGKNRYDKSTLTLGKYVTSDGTLASSGASDATDFIPINGTEDVMLSYSYDSLNSANARYIAFYDAQKNFTDYKTYAPTGADGYKSVKFNSTSNDARYVRFTLDKGAYDVQVELGSTATDYVPYNGYQVTVNLGGTYYSGTLDVVSGVFTPDTASVDLGSLTWTYQSNYPRFRADAPSGIKFPSSSSIVADAICDIYKTVSMDVTQTSDSSIGIGLTAYPYIYAHDTRYTDANVYKTAMSGVMLVYELDNPTPIQLSPTMVKALVGENHLSAPLDGQEITESKYKQMFTFDDVIAYIQSLS